MTINNSKINIFISYHKPCRVISSQYMIPIQVGSSRSAYQLNMIRDNTGDNISSINDKYCELTAQYWAYKNANADYYGFMHYRRHFIFNDISNATRTDGTVVFPGITADYIKYVGLLDEKIEEVVTGYDIVLPKPVNVMEWGAINNEIQFSSLPNLHAEDFETMCRAVCLLHPEYSNSVEEFRKSSQAYWFNMFVMKKSLFYSYCDWLFPIMNYIDEHVDYQGKDNQEKRTVAFMAERLLSIFLIQLRHDRKDLKIKECDISFIDNPSEGFSEQPFVAPSTTGFTFIHENNYAASLCKSIDKSYKEQRAIKKIYKYTAEKASLLKEGILNGNVFFYGAGHACIEALQLLDQLELPYPGIIVDQSVKNKAQLLGVTVVHPELYIQEMKTAHVVITIENKSVADRVNQYLQDAGVNQVYSHENFMEMISLELWNRHLQEGEAIK